MSLNHSRLLHFSSDYVFSGGEKIFQHETLTPSPLNWYGETKAMGDKSIVESNANALILYQVGFTAGITIIFYFQ